jgi:hypothetical protein
VLGALEKKSEMVDVITVEILWIWSPKRREIHEMRESQFARPEVLGVVQKQ